MITMTTVFSNDPLVKQVEQQQLPKRTAMTTTSIVVQTPNSAAISTLLVKPHAAVKVIKGEIHNVMNTLRTEQRYGGGTIMERIQTLHMTLNNNESEHQLPLPTVYLPPFCEAVIHRELSASVTGAALSALYKFLLYGFLLPQAPQAKEGMTMIADALLTCSFEESDQDQKHKQQNRQDEQVVLKLLDLSALVVRCSLNTVNLIDSSYVVGLLDTCLHVSHRAETASSLLKSAAADAMSQIVLQVFAGTGEPVMEARREILQKISSLCSPTLKKQSSVTISALTAVNIALETCREPLTQDEIDILKNELCKYLLQWTTSRDLRILSLVLRVIFNLFQSIRNHLKVPLEVFLTSVHLRIMENDKATIDEKEIALESLLEFCQEPLLMQDLYLNYDCDVACSNLYETIVNTLGRLATPASEQELLDSVPAPANGHINSTVSGTVAAPATSSLMSRYAVDGLIAVLDSIEKRCKTAPATGVSRTTSYNGGATDDELDETSHIESLNSVSDAELQERRQRKQNLVLVAKSFNESPYRPSWIELAVEKELLDSKDNAKGVADLLYTAPGIDKMKLGEYLSKGPEKDWPFNTEVRKYFIEKYDFAGMTFANALRKFLSKFRLPGEAQCIDRFMGSFSKELYKQFSESTIFKSSDAIYVLAFSTIMLNTDLHNPTIKKENRMTLEQFIKNNRGINEGDDFEKEYLEDLYNEIKGREIQVRREVGEFMRQHENEDFRSAWDNLLTKNVEVATPFFSPAGTSEEDASRSVAHDKEMFIHLAKPAVQAFGGVLSNSDEDDLVVKVCRGLQQVVRIGAFFEVDDVVNEVMLELLPLARDYVITAIAEDAMNADGVATFAVSTQSLPVDDSDGEGTETSEHDIPLPLPVLLVNGGKSRVDITGSAAHRGLLALDTAFYLMKKYYIRVSSAWPLYIECLTALRDAKALPPGLADLDDFADSNGDVLPLSEYAVSSKKRIEDYYRRINDPTANQKKSWLGSFFDRNKKVSASTDDAESAMDDDSVAASRAKVSMIIRAFRRIAVSAEIENVVQMTSTSATAAEATVQSLLETVDEYPYDDEPVLEQNAIFSLELAARALLSNREHAASLFFKFLNTFEAILGKVTEKEILAPFVIERIVVTVLRCSIHLYDIEELRPTLRASLHLIFMSLPRQFIRSICDRIACGLAIILRASYHLMETPNEWAFMGDTLDMLANHSAARTFIFDGIASTVECALPSEGDAGPPLSKDAAGALSKILIRFVLGFYQNDLRLSVPAMLALEKLYTHRVEQTVQSSEEYEKGVDPRSVVPDREAWQNLTVALYSVARSSDPDVSRHGTECFQRVVLSTKYDQITEEKWLSILYLMVNKQPPSGADVSRGNVFSLIGEMLEKTLPQLSQNAENADDLSDLVTQVATLAAENLRNGRRNGVTILFDKTLQTLTNLSNTMQSSEWKGEKEFSDWASETLLHELEKVGAAGAAYKNQQAIQAKKEPEEEGNENGTHETSESSDD